MLLRRPSTVPIDAASAVVGDSRVRRTWRRRSPTSDAVIHSAGIAHAMSGLPEDDYRVLNTEATIGLARAAQRAGARRFIFLSSIRAQMRAVRGSGADRGPAAAADRCLWPLQARGRAGSGGARSGLGRAAARLVYGPGVKGNMAELLRLARSPYPLPLGALRCRRSLLALDNLVGGDRYRARCAGAAAAAADRRRPAAADHPRDDRGRAARAWASARARSCAAGACSSPLCARAGRAEIYQRLAARWSRTRPR